MASCFTLKNLFETERPKCVSFLLVCKSLTIFYLLPQQIYRFTNQSKLLIVIPPCSEGLICTPFHYALSISCSNTTFLGKKIIAEASSYGVGKGPMVVH